MAENIPIDWIEELVLEEAIPINEEQSIFYGVSAIAAGNRVWQHWDLRLKTGRYRASRIGSVIHKGDFLPYFYIGTIPERFRIHPIRPVDRIIAFTQHDYDKLLNFHALPFGKPWNSDFDFVVSSKETIYRFEARKQVWEVNNPQKLPPDCNPWYTFWQDRVGETFEYRIRYLQTTAYGWDSPGLLKMAYNKESQIILFSVEGGGNVDFQELVIQVSYLGE